MQFLNKNLKILRPPLPARTTHNGVHRSSQDIRRRFVDYFVQEHQHQVVRSSPVVPFCDPTVAFVNAGMNQFKNIFLGSQSPRFKRVVNTQKCVRVGGKHNDLSVVGTDGYHHTFFEMMGNWSFGDYFKQEACTNAWHLLTRTYNIDPKRLFVTYFAGDDQLGLAADLECREIWRSLGVPDERILPFGSQDNFWEMGATGPCGPCTEIHYDHKPSDDVRGRAAIVNAGHADLTEIWNLVFIQYNRNSDKSITELPQKHVDTGMGLERLVAVLQGKQSNYDTDLFEPLFHRIHKASKAPKYTDCYNPSAEHHQLNTAYRILADHSRMITACLADGMFPDQNPKLRRVIRRAMSLASRKFGVPDLLHTTVPATVAILGETYPEMQRNLPQLQQILRHEHEVYRALLADGAANVGEILASNPRLEEQDVVDAAGFAPAYRELQSLRPSMTDNVMPGEFMFKLYDTYGLREEAIERLAEVERMDLDRERFRQCMQEARARTKSTFAECTAVDRSAEAAFAGLPYTENELKYNYRFNFATREYYSPKIRVDVLAVHPVDTDTDTGGLLCDVVLDQSTFYPEGGGQESDRGQLIKEKNKLTSSGLVQHVRTMRGGLIVHRVLMPERDWLRVGDVVELVQDSKRRTACTLHHTATHLLNACVRRVTKSVCYQKSSSVTAECLRLEMAVLGRKIDVEVVKEVQQMIESIIRTGVPVTISQIDAHDFYAADNITRIPGEVYPDRNVRILTMEHDKHGCISREPCCGTHALNTRELEHFSITHVRHNGRGAFAMTAVAGRAAMAANQLGESVMHDIEAMLAGTLQPDVSARVLQRMRLLMGGGGSTPKQAVELPYVVRVECQRILADVSKAKRGSSKDTMKDLVDTEMRSYLEHNATNPYLVHVLPVTDAEEPVPLQRATKMCADRPLLVVCRTATDGSLRARCAVPRSAVTERFGATQWLREFAQLLGAELAEPQKGQRVEEVAVMKAFRVPHDFDALLLRAVRGAEDFAEQNFAVRSQRRIDEGK